MVFAAEFVADLDAAGVPRTIDPEELRVLAERYAAAGVGRDALILALAFSVYSIVKKYRYHPSADDFLGIALLELVEAVERWRPTGANRAHVECAVRKRLLDAIDEERKLLISPSGLRKRRARGNEDRGPVLVALDFDPAGTQEHILVQEFLGSLSDPDKTIVTMWLGGRSIAEIGTTIGRGKRCVYHRLQSLRRALAQFV